ncbi:MAG: hypothetical protein RI958_801 [Actinomycetota bacterium]|jgi:saccharopine dehydrogenase-like NADP-dependent oxidoreductase
MTRVVVIGGGGGMAQPALRLLAGPGDLDLVVADVRRDAAERAAESVGATAVGLDVRDASALRDAIESADLVVNMAGPFFRFALPVLEAAIGVGTHYIDICDDWEPIEAMFALHDRAVAAGVTALIGMGASPGLSNLLAAIAVRHLDHVVDLFTAWPVDVDLDGKRLAAAASGEVGTSAAAVHWMQQISGSVMTVRAGELVATTPLESISLDYPGRGHGNACIVGHPEPIMLRRSLAPSGSSANLMVVTDGTGAFLDGLRRDIDRGELTVDAAAVELDRPSPTRIARAGLSSLRRRGPGKLPGFFALARGIRGGIPATAAARLLTAPHGMAGITGIPLALAARQLLAGTVTERGVVGPESVLDPEALFEALAPHCEPSASRWTDVVRVDVG